MEVTILRDNKNELELELESISIAEILRVYLNKDGEVTFAAWKKEHPTKKPVLLVKTKGKSPKKAIDEAISLITKELDVIESDFKKLK